MDDAFLAALAANFDDETTRLVYADWLDERGDPRGPFLRAEVEWARLHLDDEAFPAALRRLSVAQRDIDLDWALSVSRMSALVAQTWNSASRNFRKTSQDQPRDALRCAWEHAVGRIHDAFSPGREVGIEHFCIPFDYAAFMNIISGSWYWPEDYAMTLFDAATVESITLANCNELAPSWFYPDGFWLNIGFYSDIHSHLLCCDSSHRLFCHVVDCPDAHPWQYEHVPMNDLAPTFSHYVLNVLAELHLYGSPVGAAVKRSDND